MNQQTAVAKPTLNTGQQAASEDFMSFLLCPTSKEFIISGAGGTGKSFLLGQLIDNTIPMYQQTCKLMGINDVFQEIHLTATTNKAAEVLAQDTQREVQTIHSFLRLKVQNDFSTGKSKITKRNDWVVRENLIIVIDECSMIDSQLYYLIHQSLNNCKIVFVGDHCQLAPVMERISPIYKQELAFTELTEPVRNADQQALRALCDQARNTVETGNFLPIRIVPGVIDLLDDEQMEATINQTFQQQNGDARILAFTNQRVTDYNDHIRLLRGLPNEHQPGEWLVNNSAIQMQKTMLSVEQEVMLHSYTGDVESINMDDNVIFEFRRANLMTKYGGMFQDVPLPVDAQHHRDLIKHYGRKRNFSAKFHLVERYADLRPRDSSTVYKAQGSTLEDVFIDLGNIATCNNPDQVARMLYVALSRARRRIYLYGNLPEKYGGLII